MHRKVSFQIGWRDQSPAPGSEQADSNRLRHCLIVALLLVASAAGPAGAEDYAVVVIFRESFSPPIAMKPMMMVNESELGYMPTNNYGIVALQPGHYRVGAHWRWTSGMKDDAIDLDLRAGETVFVEVATAMHGGAIGGQAVFSIGGDLLATRPSTPLLDVVHGMSRVPFKATPWTAAGAGANAGLDPEAVAARQAEVDVLLSSESMREQREGALRMIREGIVDEPLLIHARQLVEKHYRDATMDSLGIDAVALLCNAIALAAQPDDIAMLKRVAADGADDKLQRYAKRYLKQFYGIEE